MSVSRIVTFATIFLSCVTLASTMANGQATQIDGSFGDWQSPTVAMVDPTGDAEGAFDLVRVEGRVVASRFYLRLMVAKELNLQSGREDDGTLILRVGLPRDRQLQLDFRGRKAMLKGPDSVSTIPWRDLQFVCLPTFATTDFELQFDLSDFGVRPGDVLTIDFDGSDKLSEPIELVANSQQLQFTNVPKTDRVKDAVRIASINTLHSGLADPQRTNGFKALLDFSEADVFCFNEEWEKPKYELGVASVLGSNVHLSWNNGCGIASKYPLQELDLKLARGCAALVSVPNHPPVVVISVHLKCCGFAGSREDLQRIREADEVTKAIRRLKQGEFGEQAKNAGIVVIGDYNLVGSRKPLDIIEDAGLSEVILKSPVDGSAATWRSARPNGSFWPGRLDCLAIESKVLDASRSFALHPQRASKLVAGLANPEFLSDHCLLVVDLKAKI